MRLALKEYKIHHKELTKVQFASSTMQEDYNSRINSLNEEKSNFLRNSLTQNTATINVSAIPNHR